MGFLAPLFLAGLLAAAIPVAIHLFHRRTEPVVAFAAMRYLRRAPVEQSRRRRLRELILLALRAAAVMLLAFAFARPYLSANAAALDAPATVILIDTSASVTAPKQFDTVRARAADALDSVPVSQAVAVVSFGSGVNVIAPLSNDRGAARAAIAALQPGAGATRYKAALRRAADLLEGRPGRVVVITDLQETGWEAGEPVRMSGRVEVAVEDVGGPEANLAVTSLRLEGSEAVAVVQNYAEEDVAEQVTFTLDDRPVGGVLLPLPARGTAEARVEVRLPKGAHALQATVGDRAGYVADNSRFAVVDADAAPVVLAVTATGNGDEAFYLERALTAGERAFRVAVRAGPSFAGMTPDDLAAVDVVVMLTTRGIDARARDLLAGYLQGGGGLLLTAGPDVDPTVLGVALRNVVGSTWRAGEESRFTLAPVDSRHPALRAFGGVGTLGTVTFTRAVDVTPSPGAAVIARYSNGSPALVEEQAGKGRILLFASDLNDRWNDFPIQPAFVPFVHEMMRYLAASRSRTSEYLVGDLPGVAAALSPGVMAHAGRAVAVNVDPRESDPSRLTIDAFLAGVTREPAAAADMDPVAATREDSQQLWRVAMLLMLVSLAAEGIVGRRLG